MANEHRVVVLRHGQTQWSLTGKHTGRTDIPLTPEGERQAIAAGLALRALHLANPLVICSPRQRAQRTAELADLHVDRTWDALTEVDYGEFEGLTLAEIREIEPNWTVWTMPCPGGENQQQISSRADMVLNTARPELAERDVVLVGHGHFSRAMLARWLQFPVVEGRRFAMVPAAYSSLGSEHGDTPQLGMHNVTAHLL
jgi:probable phosphoglycerate mutase